MGAVEEGGGGQRWQLPVFGESATAKQLVSWADAWEEQLGALEMEYVDVRWQR